MSDGEKFQNMLFSKSTTLLLAMALPCAAGSINAVFNFDSDALGTSTTFTDTSTGISATFSSGADPGGFVIYSSMFETLTGNVLGDPGPAGLDNLALNVAFSTDLSAITLDFATSDFIVPSPLTLSAYENGNLVGSNTLAGMFLAGFTFPEGEIAFSGANFNRVAITSTATDFAVDNIHVATASAPEPSTFLLLGTALVAVGRWRRRIQGTTL
jgi:hypothetical protein